MQPAAPVNVYESPPLDWVAIGTISFGLLVLVAIAALIAYWLRRGK